MRAIWKAMLCLLFVASAQAATPLIDAYAALPEFQGPQLSPDGRRYACLISSGGRQLLVVMPLNDPAAQPKVLTIDEEYELLSWTWVNDAWLIITVAASFPLEGETFRIRRAFGLGAADAKLVPLANDRAAQDGADILWVARDGSPRVLLAVQQSLYPHQETFYPEVFEVNVSTGRMSSRARPRQGVMDWYADGNGNVRMGIGYHEIQRTSTLLYREKNGETFRTIDKADSREGESLTIPALFMKEPGKALAFSDFSGFNALYEFDLKTLTLGQEVFSVPGYDIDSLRVNPDGNELLGVNYTDAFSRTQWLEPLVSKAQRDLDKAVGPGGRARIVSTSRDQRRHIALATLATGVSAYYLVDLDQRSMDELGKIRPLLDGVAPAPVRSLRYKARDGLEIEAVLTLPPGRTARNLPLIVLPHGGPSSRDDESFDWWAQYLAQLGYAIVQPNYRGSSGYGKDFEEKGEGQWGLAMQDDLLDAVAHLAAAGTIDSGRVCIAGASYGGYAALRGAQRDGAHYRCAASYAGVSDLNGMLRYDRGFLYGATRSAFWRKTSPDLREVSPINGAREFSIPVLIVHGKRDLRVPVEQSRSMVEKLTRAGRPVRYVEQPLADHHFSRAGDRLQFLQELTAFLQEHNPA